MLYAYNTTRSSALASWRCSTCFVTIAPKVNYTLLVISVPLSDTGNPSALSQIT